jgi:hypothetical protein
VLRQAKQLCKSLDRVHTALFPRNKRLNAAASQRIEGVSADPEREKVDDQQRGHALPVDLRRKHGPHDGKGQHHGGIWQEQETDECAKARRSETRHEPFRRAVRLALTAIALWHVRQCNRRAGARVQRQFPEGF